MGSISVFVPRTADLRSAAGPHDRDGRIPMRLPLARAAGWQPGCKPALRRKEEAQKLRRSRLHRPARAPWPPPRRLRHHFHFSASRFPGCGGIMGETSCRNGNVNCTGPVSLRITEALSARWPCDWRPRRGWPRTLPSRSSSNSRKALRLIPRVQTRAIAELFRQREARAERLHAPGAGGIAQ